MTTIIDDIAGPIAVDMLVDYGAQITITNTSGAFVTASRGVTTTIANQTVYCAPPYPFRGPFREESMVRVGDLVTFVAAQDSSLTFTPVAGHQAAFNSKSYNIVEVDPLYSGLSVVGWNLFLRGGAP
jgi:hypothetical protein